MDQKKFLLLVSKSLGVKLDKISLNLKFNEIEEWDSIGHLTILSSLDKATKGKSAKIKGLGTQKSLKKIWEILKKKRLTK
jgi:hypothetical protein